MSAVEPFISPVPTSAPVSKGWLQRGLFGVMAASSVLVSIASYRYVIGVAVLPNIKENTMYNPWLLMHVVSAATALLTGPIQFVTSARRRWPRAHRITGRVYVASCLLGGVTGIVLAAGTSSGPIATAGFAGLGSFWLIYTAQAWRLAVNNRISDHRRWMIRSFAMTFAAVTLRLYIPLFLSTGSSFETAYRAISWACWVPNLLIVETYLMMSIKTSPAPTVVIDQSNNQSNSQTQKQLSDNVTNSNASDTKN